MKRFGILICVLLGLLLMVGCGSVEEPALDVVPEVVEPEDRLPLILAADVPERDPFDVTGRTTDWEIRQGNVDNGGRDPFVVAGRDSDWSGEAGNVSRAGRDPFDPTGGVVAEPEPEEPEEPDEPGEQEEPQEPDVPVPDALTVQVTTLDRCWLDVFVDGVRVLRTNVPSGQTLEWTGKEVLLEQVGRDYAVNLVVNGKDYGLLQRFVLGFDGGEFVDREAGIRITLSERYTGGVLVGLRFRVLEIE
jgi:hypothetical protein